MYHLVSCFSALFLACNVLKAVMILHSTTQCDTFLQLSVKGKNKKEKLGGFFSRLTKSVDETLLSGQKVTS